MFVRCLAALLLTGLVSCALAQDLPTLLTNGDFANGTNFWSIPNSEIARSSVIAADVAGAKQALRVDLTPKAGTNPWDAGVGQKLNVALAKGDVLRVQLWLRSPQSCAATVLIQLSHDPWSTLVGRTVTARPQWREFTVQGRLAADHPAGDAQLSLQLAHSAGQIEIAAIRVNNLGPNAPDRDLAPANPLNLVPFVLPWDDGTPSVTNVSGWLDKPAGAKGFVTVRDGRLYSGDRRVRFVGTNICAGGAFPDHGTAEKVAARLAKFGINCVRFHHMDAPWGNDLIMQADKRTLAPAQLERLDYLIAQLKAQGIYTNLNLHVSRVYPGFPTWDGMPDFFKGVDTFYPPMIEMQRDYARQLLTHQNPYTKTRYVDEPAVAIVEINNENGLISQWGFGGLDGMPAVYREELQRQWNAWLKRKYPDDGALNRAWNVVTKPLGDEMLANGGFAQGTDQWLLELNGTAKATMAVGAGGPGGKAALTVNVAETDDQGWHVQLVYPGLKYEAGGLYTMEFDARADAPRSISADARQHHAPWGTLWQQDVKLTPEWKHFRFGLTVKEAEDLGRVTFSNLGAQTGAVQLANVSLRPGGGTARPAGEPGNLSIIPKADFSAYSQPIQDDWMRFLWDTEAAYWNGMAEYLRADLGVRCPIVGTAAGFSPVGLQAQLDVVDTHAYWQHPHFPGRPWDGENWVLPSIPMAGRPDGGTLPGLALSRVVGKPFLVTEYNHPAPNTHNAEGFLLAAAYAALQDWDGFFSFAYEGGRDGYNSQRILGYFDVGHHPTQMATMPVAAALFLRGDLTAPETGQQIGATPDQLYEITRKGGPWGAWANAGALGITRESALQQPVGLALGGKPTGTATPSAARLVSAGGAWTWDATKGQERVLINTARTRALIGVTTGGPFALGDVTVAPGKNLQDWAAITLTAMDGADFSAPGRFLVTATGYAENTSMGWKSPEKDTVGSDWGIAPSLVEAVPATITLPVPAARVKVWALDERGQRREALAVRDVGGKTTFDLGPAARTLWYEAEIR